MEHQGYFLWLRCDSGVRRSKEKLLPYEVTNQLLIFSGSSADAALVLWGWAGEVPSTYAFGGYFLIAEGREGERYGGQGSV